MKAMLLLALAAAVVLADPAPGIKISVEPRAGGVARTGVTDVSGNVVFDNLQPGDYLVKTVPVPVPSASARLKGPTNGGPARGDTMPPPVENHNSSRSNKTYPISPTGTTLVSVTFELQSGGPTTSDQPVAFTIGPKGGTATVTVTKSSSGPAK